MRGAAVSSAANIRVKLEKPEDCWSILAGLIARRAAAIRHRRTDAGEEGTEIWQLAEAQTEQTLCCGMLKLTGGWLVSFNAAEMGAAEIDLCVEPHRMVLLGHGSSVGVAGDIDYRVRVVKFPNQVDPQNVTIRRQGPIVDVELKDAACDRALRASAA